MLSNVSVLGHRVRELNGLSLDLVNVEFFAIVCTGLGVVREVSGILDFSRANTKYGCATSEGGF